MQTMPQLGPQQEERDEDVFGIYHIDDIPKDLSEYFQPAPEIGMEATLDGYINNLVAVFAQVKRMLKEDGTLWVNIGDSYNAGLRTNPVRVAKSFQDIRRKKNKAYAAAATPLKKDGEANLKLPGLSAKNLLGVPWRLAFALQKDGWILRSDIIWHKTKIQPEPVKDRPTKAHEYIFLLSKIDHYYYDYKAILEPLKSNPICADGLKYNGKNKRTVWSVESAEGVDGHFASFSEELIKPCLLAGCPEGGAVLDPFSGSGTTVCLAKKLNRRGVGVELSGEYVKISLDRIAKTNTEVNRLKHVNEKISEFFA